MNSPQTYIQNVPDIYNTSSLKQQSTGRHIAPLGHVIPIPSQLVFALIPSCQEAEIANFRVFRLI
jgi:hypothetical protein